METYILRTHLIDSPGVFFYYKGTAREKEVPFALNTIVAFESSEAFVFENDKNAKTICLRLNFNKKALNDAGYSKFEIIRIDK